MAIFSGIVAALGAAGFTGAVTIFGLSPALSSALLSIGKAFLWQQVAKMAAPKVPAQHVQAVVAQATGPRVRAYGRFLLGGTRALYEAKSGVLHQIIVMHHGEIAAIEGYLVDGQPVTLDGSGNVTSGAAAGYMRIVSLISGDCGNYADARTAFPTIWTTDHKLTGMPTIYTRMTAPGLSAMSQIFPRQHNTEIQAIVQASKVTDPRTMTVGFSDLTGPAAMDYLTHPDGYRIPLASVDTASFAQFTSLCDQLVTLKAGGTEKRYRIGGYYSLEDAPKDVMARILATADAQLYMTPEGKVGILGGEWLDPDVTIHADDILSMQLSDGFDEFTDFNVLKGKFLSADHRWQEAECAELVDAVSLETQPERVDTYEVDMCPSHAQMQRLLKAYRARQIRQLTGTIKTNLVGLKARWPRGQGLHVIRVVDPEFDLDMVFEVTSHSYSVADRFCVIGVASIENPYGWDAATEEGPPPPAIGNLAQPAPDAPVPQNLVLAQEVITLANAQNAVRITATVDNPGRATLRLKAEFRRVGDTAWQTMIAGEGEYVAVSGVLGDGLQYEVRASWQGRTTYTATQTITVTSNPTAPGAATGLSRSYSAPNVTLAWTNATSGYFATRIYRGTTNVFSAATLIATVSGVAGMAQTFANAPGTGTWFYWVVTINASNIEATTKTGPVSQTI